MTAVPMGDHVAEQPRVPSGMPGGGRFAEIERREADISLDPYASDEDYNADATYYFPPYPRSAKQVIAYWTTAQVPDNTLGDIRQGYKLMQATTGEDAFHGFARFDLPWMRGLKDAETKVEWDRRRANRPADMPADMVRPIARIANMYWQAKKLPPEEAEKVYNHEVKLPNGRTTTPRDLVADFDFDVYQWTFRGEDQPDWW